MQLLPEDEGEREEYFTSLKKTFVSAGVGVLSGVAAFALTWNPAGVAEGDPIIREPFALFLILAAIWIQGPVFRAMGVEPDDFESKDWLFIGFMTLTFAVATWTLMIPANPVYR